MKNKVLHSTSNHSFSLIGIGKKTKEHIVDQRSQQQSVKCTEVSRHLGIKTSINTEFPLTIIKITPLSFLKTYPVLAHSTFYVYSFSVKTVGKSSRNIKMRQVGIINQEVHTVGS